MQHELKVLGYTWKVLPFKFVNIQDMEYYLPNGDIIQIHDNFISLSNWTNLISNQ